MAKIAQAIGLAACIAGGVYCETHGLPEIGKGLWLGALSLGFAIL